MINLDKLKKYGVTMDGVVQGLLAPLFVSVFYIFLKIAILLMSWSIATQQTITYTKV